MSPSPIARREFLASGLTLAGAAVLGGVATACSPDQTVAPPLAGAVGGGGRPPLAAADLAEPRVISSVGGVLATSISASTNPTRVAGRTVRQPVTYDGAVFRLLLSGVFGAGAGVRGVDAAGAKPASQPVTTLPGLS